MIYLNRNLTDDISIDTSSFSLRHTIQLSLSPNLHSKPQEQKQNFFFSTQKQKILIITQKSNLVQVLGKIKKKKGNLVLVLW